jgi:hypothetical protein
MWLLPVVLVTYQSNNMDIQYAQAAVLRLILHSQVMESKQKQLKQK